MENKTAIEIKFEDRLKRLAADFEFFAHITSHDLRDPLRQARIYSDELFINLEDSEKAKLESINIMIDEVLEKISILRDFSYAANITEEHKKVDLNKVINEAVSELDSKLKLADADIKIETLPIVNGNEKLLKNLFLYLIDNAIKFRNESKKLKIAISVIDKNNFWKFNVIDNGIGLDKVYRELVFVLFQRLDNEIKNGSYGIGLAFARKIVENHGGEIWYESDGESGTAFHFTIKK